MVCKRCEHTIASHTAYRPHVCSLEGCRCLGFQDAVLCRCGHAESMHEFRTRVCAYRDCRCKDYRAAPDGPDLVTEMDTLQLQIGMWANATFKRTNGDFAALRATVAHLNDEVRELTTELEPDAGMVTPSIMALSDEAADCAMLLFHLAHLAGFSLYWAITEKFDACRSRQWGPPDARGVSHHVT